jgi:hypothetical protein
MHMTILSLATVTDDLAPALLRLSDYDAAAPVTAQFATTGNQLDR